MYSGLVPEQSWSEVRLEGDAGETEDERPGFLVGDGGVVEGEIKLVVEKVVVDIGWNVAVGGEDEAGVEERRGGDEDSGDEDSGGWGEGGVRFREEGDRGEWF